MRLLLALALLVFVVYAGMRAAGYWAVNAVVDQAVHAKPIAMPTVSFKPLDLRSFAPLFPTFKLDGDDDGGFEAQVP